MSKTLIQVKDQMLYVSLPGHLGLNRLMVAYSGKQDFAYIQLSPTSDTNSVAGSIQSQFTFEQALVVKYFASPISSSNKRSWDYATTRHKRVPEPLPLSDVFGVNGRTTKLQSNDIAALFQFARQNVVLAFPNNAELYFEIQGNNYTAAEAYNLKVRADLRTDTRKRFYEVVSSFLENGLDSPLFVATNLVQARRAHSKLKAGECIEELIVLIDRQLRKEND